jgi:hypothetical protein
MGLDLVEYLMAIEDAFEVAISDAEAERLETPAKLIDYLCAQLGTSPDGPPLVQTAFYRLRAALALELDVERAQIRPESTVAQLTERPENDVWEAVARRLGISSRLLTRAPAARWLARLTHAPVRSVGTIAKQLAMLRPVALKASSPGWTRAQVTEVVLRLLEHEIGISVGPQDLGLTFVRDLGMG